MSGPAPVIGLYDAPYWEHAAAGELRLQHCTACGHVRYPPGPVCPECLAPEHTWDLMSGTGTLLAWTVFHRPYFPGLPVPYVVLAVRTPEGPILVGNLAGAPRTALRHDMPLHAVFEHVTGPDGSWHLCQWAPAEPEEHAMIPTSPPAVSTAMSRGRDFDLRDRVVIITGAGQGIGREYAREYAAAGAVPVLAEVNGDAAARVAKEIDAAGGRSLAVETDVADPASVAALVDTVTAELGRVDVLVNNAAIFSSLTMRPFDEIPLDEWDAVLRVNVTGSFLCARAVAPHMRAAGWGRIVNIMSGAVPLGVRNYLHYVTSKAALVGMTNSLARELGSHGITVNAVQPGGTFHEVPRETVTEAGKAALIANQCIPRAEVPMDLVGLVLFLSTQAAGFVTGQTIACDGGLTHH